MVQGVRIVVSDDLERSRLTVFFRLLLALPHLIVLGLVAGAAMILAPVAWLVALILGRLPEGLHDFYARVVVYGVHVYAYLYLGANPWPPFMGEGTYPVDVTIPPPERQSRWSIGFRLLLALPALLLSGALGAGSFTTSLSFYAVGLGAAPIVAFLAWFACLARGRMPRGLRDLLAYALGYGAQAAAYSLLLTPRYPDSHPALAEPAPLPPHPIALDAPEDDLRRMRLLVFLRLPLCTPHFVWLALWSVVAVPVVVVGWLAALITGRLPAALHRFLTALVRTQAQVNAYFSLASELYPGFTGGRALPVDVRVAPPEPQPRWTVLLRVILALPALFLAGAVNGAQTFAMFFGWFVALFLGRMPAGFRALQLYAVRYQAQLVGYLVLLTARYPFSGPGRQDR